MLTYWCKAAECRNQVRRTSKRAERRYMVKKSVEDRRSLSSRSAYCLGAVLLAMVQLVSCSSLNNGNVYILYFDTDVDSDESTDSEKDEEIDSEKDGELDSEYSTESGATCAAHNFEIEEQIVDMLIVLDRSSSMRDDGLWEPMGRALIDVTSKMSQKINFGLLVFPALHCNMLVNQCAAPSNVRVQIGDPGAAAKIAADVSSAGGVGTCGGTPTAAALSTASKYLNALSDGNRRFVLLATDGAPNCNTSLSCFSCKTTELAPICMFGRQCLDDRGTVAAAQSLADSEYPVYVLGMGGHAPWAGVMNSIASAGGTRTYYPVDDTGQLLDTLESITKSVVSCKFDLKWDDLPGGTSRDPSKVNFYCKQTEQQKESIGNLIGFDEGCKAGTGWNWLDEDTVEFCEGACDSIRDRSCEVVTATFGCDSIPVM